MASAENELGVADQGLVRRVFLCRVPIVRVGPDVMAAHRFAPGLKVTPAEIPVGFPQFERADRFGDAQNLRCVAVRDVLCVYEEDSVVRRGLTH